MRRWPLAVRRVIGAVAQLGERRVRNAKVRGSRPRGSTNKSISCKASFPVTPFFDIVATVPRKGEPARAGARRIRHRFVAHRPDPPNRTGPRSLARHGAAACGVAPRRVFPPATVIRRLAILLSSRALDVLDGLARRIDDYVWRVRAGPITQTFERVNYEAECNATGTEPDARIAQQSQLVCAEISSDLPSSSKIASRRSPREVT